MTTMRKLNVLIIITAWVIFAAAQQYIPPKQKLARSLQGKRIAETVVAIPDGLRFSVPTESMREWNASNTWYSVGDTCSVAGTSVWVCVTGHTPQAGKEPQQSPELWRAVPGGHGND